MPFNELRKNSHVYACKCATWQLSSVGTGPENEVRSGGTWPFSLSSGWKCGYTAERGHVDQVTLGTYICNHPQ